MSPSARSNARPSSDPVTGYVATSSFVEASAPTARAIAPPTTRRAEIATTRPHGETRIRCELIRGPGLVARAAVSRLSGEARARAPVRAAAGAAVQLPAALPEQQH